MLVTANVFQPLIDVFETVLKFFHNSGGISWGWSIVLLTIAVRVVLVPLTFRQIKSMVRMQGLQPQMKAIQQKYKQDKQRQQEEIMKFYRENNVNPLGSCLPLVLQLPVFISLYYMLKKSLRDDICSAHQAAYRVHYASVHHLSSVAKAAGQTTACGVHAPGAHFLFINDLTAKASGVELVILILLYVGSQLGSTLVMSAASMDPTQRKIMMFMPLIFVLFVIRFPAGLLLYWITTNLWTVAQQYTVKRYIGPTQAVGAEIAVAGDGGGGGALAGSAATGNGSGSGGGGLGARVRDRLFSAQERALAAQRERQNAGGSGDGATKAAPPSARSGTKAKSGGNGGAASGGNGGKSAAKAGSSAGASAKGAGRSKRRGGSANGSGDSEDAAANGARNGSAAGAPPPRSPRKKKKRSGRRR